MNLYNLLSYRFNLYESIQMHNRYCLQNRPYPNPSYLICRPKNPTFKL